MKDNIAQELLGAVIVVCCVLDFIDVFVEDAGILIEILDDIAYI